MNCIDKIRSGETVIIGIKNCDDWDDPSSGIFFDDLAGMDVTKYDSLNDDNEATGYDLVKAKLKLAPIVVFNEIKTRAFGRFNIKETITNNYEGEYSVSDYWDEQTADKGLYISRKFSKLAKIRIKSITVLAYTSGAKKITITDGRDETEEDITLVSGQEVTIYPDKVCYYDQVKITIDASDVKLAQGVIDVGETGMCNNCTSKINNQMAPLTVSGYDGVNRTSRLYGIKADIVLECDEDLLLCTVLNKLDMAIWYKAGILFNEEHIATDRLNMIALFDRETAAELLKIWEARYKAEINRLVDSLQDFLRGFTDLCITCNKGELLYGLP